MYFFQTPYTPLEIKSSIDLFTENYKNDNQTEATIINLNNTFEELQYNFDDEIILIIDETYNLKLGYEIQNYALQLQIPVFYTKNSSAIRDNSVLAFMLKPPLSMIKNAYNKLIHYLGTPKLAIIWVFNEENEILVRFFDTDLNFDVISIVIPEGLDQDSINNIISRDLKPLGIAYIMILSDSENCKIIQKSLIEYNMIVSGYVIILGHSCLNNSLIDGSLLILPSNDIYSATDEESYLNSLDLLIKNLQQNWTQSQLWIYFDEFKKLFDWDFTIINQNSKIGIISNETIEISENIIYPGGSTNLPESSTINILISGNVGALNPPGFQPSTVNALNHDGSYFAVRKINESKEILQNFHLKLNDQINCGATIWVNNYTAPCLTSKLNEMGVAYLPSYVSSITLATLSLFDDLNFNIPLISGINSARILSNSTLFPTFTRISTNSDYMGKTWALYMKIMGWTSCVVFYADDAYDISLYNNFLYYAEARDISIINKEEYRKIPFTYNNSQLEKYRPNFQEAIDQNCNIFFIFGIDPSYIYIFDSLYDMGLRRGDALFLLNALTGSDIFYKAFGYNLDKVQELFYGTFFLFIPEWTGVLGSKLRDEFDELYPDNGHRIRCVHYDAVLAVAEAIQMLLNLGKNYENFTLLNKGIKSVRFRGCSGVVMIEKDLNDRILTFYSLYNSYYNISTQKWETTEVGNFSPYSGTFFKLIRPMVWPTGSSPPPTFKHYDCPYKDNKNQTSIKSKLISATLCAFIVIFCIFLIFFVAKIQFSNKLQQISEKSYFADPDYWIVAIIFIESFQFQGIGPSLAAFNLFYYNSTLIASYNLDTLLELKGTIFWKIFYAALSLCIFWFLVELTIKLKNQFEKIWVISILEITIKIEVIISHLMSSILFQPILTMLLRIISCDYGSTSNWSNSYLNYDCQLKCWESSHISILVPTILTVLIYIAISIKIRPLWQEDQSDLNIKEDYTCMMVKIIVKVSLIVVYVMIKTTNELAHCSVFLVIMFGYLIFIYFWKNYNYDRAHLMEISLIACVIWNSVLSFAYMLINAGYSYIWLSVQFLGILIIIMWSLVVKARLPPSMLVKKEGKSIWKLFRFSLMGSNFWSVGPDEIKFSEKFANIYINEDGLSRANSDVRIDVVDSPNLIYVSDDRNEDSKEL